MQVNFSVMYDDVCHEIGVPAVLIVDASTVNLTVIDDTRPKVLPAGSGEVHDVGPGAYARIAELTANNVTRDEYLDAVLEFNGRTWVVRSYELRGSPNGEDQGWVRLLLKEPAIGR
jgi:hypothetical protein